MYDAIVLGYGPAGASAAIYLLRAGLKTLILGRDGGALSKASAIENYYGLPGSPTGASLIESGLAQIRALGGEVKTCEVTSIGFGEGFSVATTGGEYDAKCLLIAVGRDRKKPSVAGLEKYDGRGVSYCAVCDGFFYKGKSVAVLGEGEYALSEARELAHHAARVTILTNGREPGFAPEGSIIVDRRKITAIIEGEAVGGVVFEDDGTCPADGIFVAEGSASGLDFAKKLGLAAKNSDIAVDDNQMTNLPGIFAAGDCTGGILQVSVAVGEGARAGLSMIDWIRKKSK